MKTFKQFQEQVSGPGGSPGQIYKPADPGPKKGTPPPEGFREKYGLSPKQTKLAQQAPTKPTGPDGTPLPLDLRTPAEKYLDVRRTGNKRIA